jgi:hypothetical protein
MRQPHIDHDRQPRLLAVTVLWLLAGSVLLLTTLVPAHTALLGWAPTFWLLVAPLAVLLTLDPTLPRQLLTLRRTRRHNASRWLWH